MRIITIIIPDEKPLSWNKFYAGSHWSKRKREADRVHFLVRSYIDPNWIIFENQVDITITAYFKNNSVRLDASNITAKLYEDGLIGHLIENDSWREVRSMKTISLLDRENPRVEITITEAIGQPIDPGWTIEVIKHFSKLSQAEVTEQTAWDAINFAKAALAMTGELLDETN